MTLQIKLALIFLMSILLSACANTSLKAPSNQCPEFCYCNQKTQINA